MQAGGQCRRRWRMDTREIILAAFAFVVGLGVYIGIMVGLHREKTAYERWRRNERKKENDGKGG